MKKLITAAMLCCSLLGVAYGQEQSQTNDSTKTESCTVKESGWEVDIGVAKAGDVTRETHCETKESAPKDPKSPAEPKEPKEPPTPRDRNK